MVRKLDRAVKHVSELAKRKEEEPPPDSDYTSDSSDVSMVMVIQVLVPLKCLYLELPIIVAFFFHLYKGVQMS